MKRSLDMAQDGAAWTSGLTGPKRSRDDGVRYYGRLSTVELLGRIGAAEPEWLMQLDCLGADWFDGLRDDLGDLPAWDTSAQVASLCMTQFSWAESGLLQLVGVLFGNGTGLADVAGRWVQVWLRFDRTRPGA